MKNTNGLRVATKERSICAGTGGGRRATSTGDTPSPSNTCLDGEHARCCAPCACPCHLTDEQWGALSMICSESRPTGFIYRRLVRKLVAFGLVVEGDSTKGDNWVRATKAGREAHTKQWELRRAVEDVDATEEP